jgi:hypothetical protein
MKEKKRGLRQYGGVAHLAWLIWFCCCGFVACGVGVPCKLKSV